jgi:hypothetical protein
MHGQIIVRCVLLAEKASLAAEKELENIHARRRCFRSIWSKFVFLRRRCSTENIYMHAKGGWTGRVSTWWRRSQSPRLFACFGSHCVAWFRLTFPFIPAKKREKGRSLDLHMHATTAVYALYCTRANTRSTASSCERQLSTYIHMLPYNLLRRRSMGRKLRHLIWNGRSACQLQLI